MAKRLIIPKLFTITVVGNTGSVALDFDIERFIPLNIQGHLTYIRLSTALAGNPKGKVRITDDDNGVDLFKDPKPGDADVQLDFYTYEMRIPVNGAYTFTLDDAPNGTYTLLITLEERPGAV